MLWAKCNREAVEEAGLLGDCVFFMRAGAAGSQRYSTLIWAGDQCVDWSEDDGLPSVITAALTLGMSGFGLHCCDIGGYTTLFHLKRDEELLLRWLEFACFTPVMRTHEGNRPDSNVQLYDSEELIAAAARLCASTTALLPYLKACVQENEEKGLPVMRPLFLAAPEDEPRAYDRGTLQLSAGRRPAGCPGGGARSREPDASGCRRGSGSISGAAKRYSGGETSVPAPMGKPPVFWRGDRPGAALFETAANLI